MRRLLLPLTLALVLLPGPGRAHASVTQETMAQDDNHLVYGDFDTTAATYRTLRALGVDRVRITVAWAYYAPDAESRNRPDFDATNPDAYPSGVWEKLDRAIGLAYSFGVNVDLNVTAPGPLWAMTPAQQSDRPDVHDPNIADYENFLTAVATRYSGGFVPAGGAAALPGVRFWSIWNEPNIPGWLTPQSRRVGGRFVPAAPAIYRRIVAAGTRALQSTGHGRDTVLIGELASKGDNRVGTTKGLKPLAFIRELYCVDRRLHSLRGRAARDLGCPARGFRARNPGLFSPTGWAHHPYSLIFAPDVKGLDRDFATLADLPKLEGLLDGIFRHYGSRRRLPLWLTEYGYQTNPPDPTQIISPATQGRYLNQADYMTFRDPRVRALSQFLLRDDPPSPVGNPWRTFQSGLEFADGRPKSSFGDYRLPLWIPRARVRRGSGVTVWGLLRPAAAGSRQTAFVQFRPLGATRYVTVRSVRVRSARHAFSTRIPVRAPGRFRLRWGGFTSRPQLVTLR